MCIRDSLLVLQNFVVWAPTFEYKSGFWTMETIYLPAVFPDEYRCVYIAQFDHVKNGSELRHALVQASKTPVHSDERRKMDMAFVDARLVCSRQQLITAILQAIVGAQRRDIKREELEPLAITGLKTPSIHSDILWTLNPNNNVRLNCAHTLSY